MASVSVLDHNVGHGSTGDLMEIAERHDVDAVTMQECTESQYGLWRSAGWDGRFVAMTDAHENAHGERQGQVILSRDPIGASDVEVLGVGGLVETGKEFNLLCAEVRHPKQTFWVCTTHLWSAGRAKDGTLYSQEVNNEVRLRQAKKIAAFLDRKVTNGLKVVLTGDFNETAKTRCIDEIHRVNKNGSIGTAKFWEADQFTGQDSPLRRGGRDTVEGRKIDYWFASHRGADPRGGLDLTLHDARPNGGVPHDKILRGKVTWS